MYSAKNIIMQKLKNKMRRSHLSQAEFDKRAIMQLSCLQVEANIEPNISGHDLEFFIIVKNSVRTSHMELYKNIELFLARESSFI